MAKMRTVKKYTDEAVKQSQQMSREDYKAIKHMDKIQLTAYMQRVYWRGYKAGVAAAEAAAKAQKPEAATVEE